MSTDQMLDARPLLGVSLDFLLQLCEDNRLRRPIHKLGRPTASLASMKAPSLRAMSRALRVHSDLPASQEFALYGDEASTRETLLKGLKRVPFTSTHIVTCIIRPAIKRLKIRRAQEAAEAAAKAAEEAALQKAKDDEQTRKNGNVPLKKKKIPPPPAPPPPLPPHVNDNSYASLMLAGNDVGPATDFVSYSRQSSFRDLVDALVTEDQESVLNRCNPNLIESMRAKLRGARRFYYIDIFCECCDTPPSFDDESGAFFDTTLPEVIGTIGRTVLVPGCSLFEKVPEKNKRNKASALTHSRVLWDLTVSTAKRGSEFSVALTRRDQTALEKYLAQAADIEFMLSIIGAGRPRDVGLPDTRPSGNEKTAAAVEADVDEMAFFLTLQDLLDQILETPSAAHSAVMHGCDSLEQNQYVEVALREVMGRQFDGGFLFVDKMVNERLTGWFADALWSVAVKWRLVGDIFIQDGAVKTLPVLTGRSSRPSTAHSRKSRPGSSRKRRSRSESRAGSRPNTAKSITKNYVGGRRHSSVLQKNRKGDTAVGVGNVGNVDADEIEAIAEEDEDPIFELLLVIAKFYYQKHRTLHTRLLHLRIPLETDTAASLLLISEKSNDIYADEASHIGTDTSPVSLPSTDLIRAEALLRVVLEQREADFGAAHAKTLDALTVLAKVLHQQGRLSAAEHLYRRILQWFPPAIHRRPVEHWDVAQQSVVASTSEMEVVVVSEGLKDTGNDANAKEVGGSPEVGSTLPDFDVQKIEDLSLTNRRIVRTMRLFGLVLKDKEIWSESELMLTRVCKAVEQSLGPAAVETLAALDEVARLQRAAGRVDEAVQIMRRTLNKREANLPENDERTVDSCAELGMLFANEGAFLESGGGLEVAQGLLARALEARRPKQSMARVNQPETTGADRSINENVCKSSPAVSKAWSVKALDTEYSLAWVLARRGRLRRSENMARHVLSVRDKTLGPMALDSIRAADRLGDILLMRLEQKGDGKSEPEFWPEDPGYETELEKKVRLCTLIQMWWRRTWRNIKRMRAIREKEEADPVFKMMRAEHATHLRKLELEDQQKKVDDGAKGQKKVEEGDEPVQDREGLQTLDIVESISKMQEDLEGDKVASTELEIENIFRRCASGFEDLLGSMHPHTLRSTRRLGNFLVRTSSLEESHSDEEAEDVLRATYRRRQIVLGEKHRDTLTSCADLAALLFKRVASSRPLNELLRDSDHNNAEENNNHEKEKLLEECEGLFRRALSLRDETLGPVDPLTLLSVNQLAVFLHHKRARSQPLLFTPDAALFGTKPYANDKTTKELVDLFQRDLDGCLHHQNDPLATAKALSNLALVHCEAGDLTPALGLYKKCLSERQTHLGDNDIRTWQTQLNLGKVLQATGDLDAAVAYTRTAYQRMESVLGWHHDNVLDAALRLATVLVKRDGERDESVAESLLRKTVDGRKRTLGISRAPKTLAAMSMLARLLVRQLQRKTGEVRSLLDKSSPSQRDIRIEAEKLLRLIAAERRKMYGDDNPRTLSSRRRLAEALHQRYLSGGDNADVANAVLEEALKEARACAEGLARRRRIDEIDGAVALLRQILQSMGLAEEADGVEVEFFEMALGVENLRTLNAMRRLALKEWQFDKRRRGAGAVELLRKCALGFTTLRSSPTNPYNKHRGHGMYRGNRGSSDPHCSAAVSAMEELASAIERSAALAPSGRRDLLVECERVRRDIVRTLVESHGSTHEKTLRAVDRLGTLVWKEFGRLSEARIMLQRVVDGRTIRLGQRHAATNQALRKLSLLVLEIGDVECAEALSRQALEGFLLRREERGFEFEGRDADVVECARVLAEILSNRPEGTGKSEAAAILTRYA